MVAPLAGGLVDRFGAAKVVRTAYLLAAVSVPLFWAGGRVLAALFMAAVLVHVALVASHVANQTLALTTTSTPAAANTAYAVAGFAGGAAASAGSAYTHFGWGRGVRGGGGVAAAGVGDDRRTTVRTRTYHCPRRRHPAHPAPPPRPSYDAEGRRTTVWTCGMRRSGRGLRAW
ncbi:hypothetical protein SGLAM104S_08671 [Streptomyces glaucescens]